MRSIGCALILSLLFAPFLGKAQSNESNGKAKPIKLERSQNWTPLTDKNGVEVQYKYVECHDNKNDIHKENVMLRFENTTDQKVTVSWKHLLWYDGSCDECGKNDPEFRKQLSLDPGQVLKGDCDRGTPQKLKVFARFLDTSKGRPDTELTGIRLADLEVE